MSPSEEAVAITTTWPSGPPAKVANRDRISLSRTLSSAPPISMTGPAPPRARSADPGSGAAVTVRESVAPGVRRSSFRVRSAVGVGGSVRRPNAPLGIPGRAQDQPVVGFDHVDRALEPRRHPQLETVLGHQLVSVLALVREVERHAVPAPMDPNGGGGVESAGGLVRALQNLDGPVGELERHAIIVRGRDPTTLARHPRRRRCQAAASV